MKQILSPTEVLKELFSFILISYSSSEEKKEGSVQFHLMHEGIKIDCYIKTDLNEMTYSEGVISNPIVTLHSTLYNWLDLAANRLNPIFGVMTRKLKFEGDTSFLSSVMPGDMFDLDLSEYADPVTPFERNPQKHWKKPKKIVIINSSPRGKRGFTHFYLNAFIEGLATGGSDIEVIFLHKHKIRPCTGCWLCWMKDTGECVYKDKDDAMDLYEKVEEADMIVLAFPLYADGTPGILKNFIDRGVHRLYPYMIEGLGKTRHPRRKIKNQSAVIFSICGFPEIKQFNAIREYFKEWSHNFHAPIVAEILRPGCMYLYNNPLNYQKLNLVLTHLKKAGKDLYNTGKVNKKTRRVTSQQVGTIEDFKKDSNFFWTDKVKKGDTTY